MQTRQVLLPLIVASVLLGGCRADLSGLETLDVAELGPNRAQTLVFYCHSEMCGAAADAARRAIAGGYRNVSVLAPGIRGWRAAGQPVDSPATKEVGS